MRFDLENIKSDLRSKFNLHEHCSSQSSLCLVAEANEMILGYICCTRDMEIYQLLDVFVASEVRGQGVGRALVDYTRSIIGSDASLEAMLEMDDAGNLSFLKSCGFSVANALEGDVLLLRVGDRFRIAPSINYRITKEL
jgi:ribosomal protein S18 acetylase RimI-like enzyme